MSDDPFQYYYPAPEVSPYTDINAYVGLLLAAVDEALDRDDIWRAAEVEQALGYIRELKAWIADLPHEEPIIVQEAYVRLAEVQAPNTNAGTFSSGSWQIRNLNGLTDDIAGIVEDFETGRVKLPAGKYRAWVYCPVIQVDRHIARLYNQTADSVLLTGTSEYAAGSVSGASSASVIAGVFELSESSWVRVEHRCSRTQSSNGFGNAANHGVNETYCIAQFWRIPD